MMGAQFALLRREQGRFQEFQSIIGFAADHRADITVWKAAGVLANLEAGEQTRAREDFEELAANQFAVVPDDFFRSITLGMLAESCAQLGDVERAASLYDLLLPHREQLVLLTFSVLFLGSVSYYLGILALTTGAHADAAQHLHDAMEYHSRLGAAPFHTRTQLQYRASYSPPRHPATGNSYLRYSTRSSMTRPVSAWRLCWPTPRRCERHCASSAQNNAPRRTERRVGSLQNCDCCRARPPYRLRRLQTAAHMRG